MNFAGAWNRLTDADAWRKAAWAAGPPLLAAAVCLLVALAALAAMGFAPGEVLATVWTRSLWADDPQRRLSNWADILRRSTPLLLCGLAITVAFRASVWNIGAQGQYLLGAIAATAVGVYLPLPAALAVPVLLAGSMLAGAALAALASLLEWWRGVSVVLSTLLLNFVAQQFLRYLLQGPMDHAGLRHSPPLREAAMLGTLGGTSLHWGFAAALLAAAAVWFMLHRSAFGFRLRIVGENPIAARAAGIHVPRVGLATLAFSGALAGLAGGVEVSGVTHQLFLSDAANPFGFTGIAVALLGRLSPAGVVGAAMFFGFLNSAFPVLEIELRLPAVTSQAIQGLVILLMLVFTTPRLWKQVRAARATIKCTP